MCGLAGYALSRAVEDRDVHAVEQVTRHQRNRGPDAEGIWVGDGIVLGHRRLAILDVDARANQPMISRGGRYAIVLNGEIYNFRELRSTLEIEGVTFHTTSDTEVLLALYAREGDHMLKRLRGMFVFGIWDRESRELFIARDPYGIKPLYYTQTQDGVLFASQVKALMVSGLTAGELEPAGLVGFYLWGSVPEPWTLYRHVRALPAGHSMRIRQGIADTPVSWHDIRVHWQEGGDPNGDADLDARVREAVMASVRAHLVADVPVSVFLSGGIDSTVLAGAAAALGAQVEGITVACQEFAGQPEDEVPAARAVAAHYGLSHSVRTVTRAEFEQDLPRILAAMDQPTIDGVNTWFASKAAAERGYKVVISGLGGDELFCGYSLFQRVPRLVAVGRALASIPGGRELLRGPCAFLARQRSQPKFVGLPTFMDSFAGAYFLSRALFLPDELTALLDPRFVQQGLGRLGGSPPGMISSSTRDSMSTVALMESTLYLRNQLLRDSDWASMAHSLELRTPLVDATLLGALGPFVSRFSRGRGKRMLANVPPRPLPKAAINRPKTGFMLPFTKWLSGLASWSSASRGPYPAMGAKQWTRRWASIVAERTLGN